MAFFSLLEFGQENTFDNNSSNKGKTVHILDNHWPVQ